MGTEDFARYRRRYERAREKVEESDGLTSAERRALLAWANEQSAALAVSTLGTYLTMLRKAAERTDLPLTEWGEADANAYFHDLRHNRAWGRGSTPMSTGTVGKNMSVVKIFFEWDGREWAEDISPDQPEEQHVDPTEMLGQDDIAALIRAADRQRDVALVEFFADTAARRTMVGSLRVGDVDLDGAGATFTPNPNALGLKGAAIKPYPIIDARATLRNYLRQTHPRPDDDEAALFHKLERYDGEDGALSPTSLADRLRLLADRANIDKPVNPHNFRHSAITRMYREDYSMKEIQHRVSWEINTDMWETYIHLTAEDMNQDIFAAAGVLEPEDEAAADRRRQRCGNCHEVVPKHAHYCPNCSEPASAETRDFLEEVTDSGIDQLVNGLDPRERRIVETVLAATRRGEAQPPPTDSHD